MGKRLSLRLGLALLLGAGIVTSCAVTWGANIEGMPRRPTFYSAGLQNATGVTKITNGNCALVAGWSPGPDWTVGPATCDKAAGGASTLSQTSANMQTPLLVGDVYLLTWTATALAGGSLTPSVCGVTLPARTGAGTFRDYARCTSTAALTFTPSVAGVTTTLDSIALQFVAHAEADQVVAWEEDAAGMAGQGSFHLIDESGAWYRLGNGLALPNGTTANPAILWPNTTFTTSGIFFDRDPILGGITFSLNGFNFMRQFGSLALAANASLAWSGTANNSNTATDLWLSRDGANTLQLGLDAAAPATQLLKGGDATGGGPTNGATLQLQGGSGVGGGNYGRVQITNSPFDVATAESMFWAGTAGTPAIGWRDDADGTGTGFYRRSANTITATINGTAQTETTDAGFQVLSTSIIGFSSGGVGAATDTYFTRESPATIQLGYDGNPPVAYTLKSGDPRAGTDANTAGASLTLAGGRGTGSAGGGDTILQGAHQGAAGNAHNPLGERFRVHAPYKVLTDATVTDILTVTVPNSGSCALQLSYSAHANDATNAQSHTAQVYFNAAATNAGAVTANQAEHFDLVAATAGTYTDAWSSSTAANSATLRASFDSSLNVDTHLTYTVFYANGCTVTYH